MNYYSVILIAGSRDSHLDKMVYLHNRRFLPMTSPLRLDQENFPQKSTEMSTPPAKRQYNKHIMAYHHAYDNAVNK